MATRYSDEQVIAAAAAFAAGELVYDETAAVSLPEPDVAGTEISAGGGGHLAEDQQE